MKLQWSPPLTGGSKIIRYHITVDPSPSDETTCPGGECNTTELSLNVTGLKFNQYYTFTVRAENIKGIGNETSQNFVIPGLGIAINIICHFSIHYSTVFVPLTASPSLSCLWNSNDNRVYLTLSWDVSCNNNYLTNVYSNNDSVVLVVALILLPLITIPSVLTTGVQYT